MILVPARFAAGLVALLILMAAAEAAAQTSPVALDEAALRALLPGSTMSAINSRGQRYRESYGADGRFTASSTRQDGTCCISDGGKWEIEAGQFCRQYDTWGDRRRFCHTIGRSAEGYVDMRNGARMEFSR
jgi:hypothetical protein